MNQYRKSGLSPEDAWNKASIQLITAAEVSYISNLCSTITNISLHINLPIQSTKAFEDGDLRMMNKIEIHFPIYCVLRFSYVKFFNRRHTQESSFCLIIRQK